ncbi:MAG: hypothetical protein M3O67_00075 [Bacteroidota bacterium]|nr:hypothetical protein [Bacteroidota bacterium]
MLLFVLNLSIIEIVVLQFGAIILGIAIHFFIISRRNLRSSSVETQKVNKNDEWKLKYFNDVETKDKELSEIKQRVSEAEENNKIYAIELDEMRRQNKKLHAELENQGKSVPQNGEKPDYIEQLREAQTSLIEHNEKINKLLSQIDIVKETEEKQREILKDNEELNFQLEELKYLLSEKENEINAISQKAHLTSEMTSMLDNAYTEFNNVQKKCKNWNRR